MLNNIVLVGRLKELHLEENNEAVITLATPRYFQNEDGEYLVDYIDCTLKGEIATSTIQYCKSDDIIGIKGRIETTQDIDENNNIFNRKMIVVADKVTFLNSHNGD